MIRIKSLLIAVAATGLFAAPAAAGPSIAETVAELATVDGIAETEVRDVNREIQELQRDIREAPNDPDSFNTALVFTNPRWGRAVVKCAAFNGNGIFLGAARTHVPANGTRFLRASDLSNGRDYIGNVICKASGRVIGSIVLVGPSANLTDLRVLQRGGKTWTLLRFPLVASF